MSTPATLHAAEDDGEFISLQMAMRAPTMREVQEHVREAYQSALKRRQYASQIAEQQKQTAA